MLELVRIGNTDGDVGALQDVLQQLMRFVGNDSSECSEEQANKKLRYKKKLVQLNVNICCY